MSDCPNELCDKIMLTHKLSLLHGQEILKAIHPRLYNDRDEPMNAIQSFMNLALRRKPSAIVVLGHLSAPSLNMWLQSAPTAHIYAADLNVTHLRETINYFPLDLTRITLHEQAIPSLDFSKLWTEHDRVLFFIGTYDLQNAPIMEHVLHHALPLLPRGSMVIIDNIWHSPVRLTQTSAQNYFDTALLACIDELQCNYAHYAPYHLGGSFMGFSEAIPLLEFVNSRGIDLGYDPGGKHVWFPWDGERHKNQKPLHHDWDERESGFIEYNPLVIKANAPLASRILPKVARLYQQGQLQESARILIDLINKEPSQSACFALAVCLARLGQLDDANKLAQLARQAGQENWRVNRLADDLEKRVGRPKVQMTGHKGLTIFAVPKAFKGHEAAIQKNAIRSWARLDPKPEIILMGNDHGVREMALEVGARHIPEIQRNEFGTPLLDDIFYQAELASSHSLLAYLNADIILTSDFIPAINQVTKQFSEFLVVGQRLNINIKQEINFDSGAWENDIKKGGLLHPVTGVDYFIFPRGLWSAIPPFALGRTAWDLWILGRALDLKIPLIDATEVITAIHQNHDYGHLRGGKEEAWSGIEAKRNVAIVGGYQAVQRNITSATYKLTANKLVKTKLGNSCEDEAPCLNKKGEDLYAKGHIDTSINFFEKAIEKDRNCVEAYNNLGVAHGSIGNLQIAIDYLNHARKLKPNCKEAVMNLAKIYKSQNNIHAAKCIHEDYLKQNKINTDMTMKFDPCCQKKSDQAMITDEKSVTWESIKQKSRIMLYAGDIPDIPGYLEMIGLSLNKSDERHLCHDITNPFSLPDNAVEFFQSEDVFEHIAYDKLPSVISEIYRVLKPGGLFRLSVPDYRCDILQKRVVRDANNNIIFDPEGGGTTENPGHVWFPHIELLKELLQSSPFSEKGKIEYLHYYAEDGTPVTKPIDYSKGLVRRTPDFDKRVQNPYRPMSMVIDIVKNG